MLYLSFAKHVLSCCTLSLRPAFTLSVKMRHLNQNLMSEGKRQLLDWLGAVQILVLFVLVHSSGIKYSLIASGVNKFNPSQLNIRTFHKQKSHLLTTTWIPKPKSKKKVVCLLLNKTLVSWCSKHKAFWGIQQPTLRPSTTIFITKEGVVRGTKNAHFYQRGCV